MPKISVIMPSLNVAPYIRECLDSVINQTLRDLEIICVDAGSTDGTWEILEKYAEMDQRVRLLRSEKKSYGYQMNLGIREATGDYIGIVETDDYIIPEMYAELYTYAAEHDADFVKSDFDIFNALGEGERLFLRCFQGAPCNMPVTADSYIHSMRAVEAFIWNGIYKRDFLLENRIWFQETPGAAFQDVGFRYQVALCVKQGFFLDRSFYRYRRDNAGSSTYNSKCILYNWWEYNYLLEIAQKRGWTSQEQMRFLARDMAQIVYNSYIELLTWGTPADGTNEAMNGLRNRLKDFVRCGVLDPLSVPRDFWPIIRLLIENPDFSDYYAHLKAESRIEAVQKFLKNVAQKEWIVLFGSGQIGGIAYCMIRNSGLQNVVAFCDNDKCKWEKSYMGRPVMSPKDAVKEFPEAHFIITNRAHQDAIRAQLCTLGVSVERITGYHLDISPMFATNMSLRHLR